ncbi:hypothetical protein M7I_3118 [Glarea lozoyensis 74030]|uniref:Uncharacterized protein n=1 Tax=Glarea lozoyensis (strain ATCC 74030 / MF5533) TaxID=1104152 RepID=H0EKL9_GLAL7|nr:hypothetical protein M7I_3118 [Glarea lozoyensis 74030]
MGKGKRANKKGSKQNTFICLSYRVFKQYILGSEHVTRDEHNNAVHVARNIDIIAAIEQFITRLHTELEETLKRQHIRLGQ